MLRPISLFLSTSFLRAPKNSYKLNQLSIISIISIAISFAIFIFISSIMSGFDKKFEKTVIGISSHIQIENFTKQLHYQTISARLSKNSQIQQISPYIYGQSILFYGGKYNIINVLGVNEAAERKTSTLFQYTASSNTPLDKQHIIIGSEISKHFGKDVGAPFSLQSPNSYENHSYLIGGLLMSGLYDVDSTLVVMHFATAAELLGYNAGMATGLRIKVQNKNKVGEIKVLIQKELGSDYVVSTWKELNRNMIEALILEKRIMFVILCSLLLLCSFSVASGVIITISDRQKDIGILKALGIDEHRLIVVFLIQSLVIYCTGASIGILIGSFLTVKINSIFPLLRNITPWLQTSQEVLYLTEIPFLINFFDILYIFTIGLILTSIILIFPLRRIRKINVIEVIRSA